MKRPVTKFTSMEYLHDHGKELWYERDVQIEQGVHSSHINSMIVYESFKASFGSRQKLPSRVNGSIWSS
jgi:hypothetical protein